VTSTEAYEDLVKSWFGQFFGRVPNASEIDQYTGQLIAGATEETVQAGLLGSVEFYQDAGGTDAGFVAALFRDVLDRSPAAAETNSWVGQIEVLEAQESDVDARTQVALDILTSHEHVADDLKGWFETFLHRPPAPIDTATYGYLQQTAGDQTVVASILGSNEFFQDSAIACYAKGTLIGTSRSRKRVEDLKIGDKVMTMSGSARPIKWIRRRSYGGRFIMGRKDILPICIKAGALGDNVPQRDLWISPHHAMFLDSVLIDAKDLINGVSIVQAERIEKVEYFHIELETHDVIVAEGALSESFIDDDSPGIFHNAHEYSTLYAGEQPAFAQYCASRCEDGYEVENARRRIALRAGLLRAADGPRIGALRGYVDAVGPRCIEGWAQHVDHPEAPVCLDIYADGQLIGQTLANRCREDLKHAGLGSGCHSFVFVLPAGVAFAPHTVEVRRALDGESLTRGESRNKFVRDNAAA
jgi:Hint domain/Domain of unknown function (DUF4214)